MSILQTKPRQKHRPPAVEPIVSDARRQHSRILPPTEQIADAYGDVGAPWGTEGLLARLERHGDISAQMRVAGEHFHELFHQAMLDPLKAADVSRIAVSGRPMIGFGNEGARFKVRGAIDALGGHGSPAGCCVWLVIGCDHSMRQWAASENWKGRPIREEVAKGILIGALGTLVKYFGG